MACRQLKSPRSLSGRSMHLTFVTKWSWSWSWMTYCHPLCAMSTGPPILSYSYFKILPWKSMVKVMCVVKGQGHVWPPNSKVKVMVKVWDLEFNWYVGFLFHGNRTTFGWDIGNSIFDLENSRYVIFKRILVIDGWGIPCEIALIWTWWMSLDLNDEKSTLVQVMAWCHQAASHYLNQCWPRSLSPYGITRPQWVNFTAWLCTNG